MGISGIFRDKTMEDKLCAFLMIKNQDVAKEKKFWVFLR